MEAKKSPLKLDSFFLMDCHFGFVSENEEDALAKFDDVQFEDYRIEIDFGHQDTSESEFLAFVDIAVNENKELPGYYFQCGGMAKFILDSDNIKPESKAYFNLKHYSTINIVINQLRNVMSHLSAFAPYGRYNLPAIDISDLFEKKIKEQEAEKNT